jgi:hypothetical protein
MTNRKRSWFHRLIRKLRRQPPFTDLIVQSEFVSYSYIATLHTQPNEKAQP